LEVSAPQITLKEIEATLALSKRVKRVTLNKRLDAHLYFSDDYEDIDYGRYLKKAELQLSEYLELPLYWKEGITG